MPVTQRILVCSSPSAANAIDDSILTAQGYDVTPISNSQAIESWLNTFLDDVLLILVHPSASEGLQHSKDLLETHPGLPIILVSNERTLDTLKQALVIGLIDYLTLPLEPSTLLDSVQRGIVRQKYWQESKRIGRVLAELKDGIILTDMDGHLLLVNQSVREIFKLEDEPVEGKPLAEVFDHPDLLDMLSSRNAFPHRSEITFEDGRVFSAQASLIPSTGIAVTFQEITHLKQLDRIKTDFVNTVSHDLRSPLTAIYGFVGLIDRVGPTNEQQAEFIHHIQASVQHITDLINDLLELGRVEADYDIQMEDVNLNEIITQSIGNLDYQLNLKLQELDLSLRDDIPVILGNPIHLQRMVINLIENAIKFTQPLGKISVRCKSEASQLILEVEDNGPGIPIEDQPHVFDKFYRGKNLSENTPGTGLGLSIVNSIVEKHHGRIWLESSPTGTTFTVILPIK